MIDYNLDRCYTIYQNQWRPVMQPKPLNPRSLDVKYTGIEPQWSRQPAESERRVAIMKAFTWYGYYYGKKDAKNMILDWLKNNDAKSSKSIGRVPDNRIPLQAAWL